jgi:cell division transport system permease protein
VKLIATPADRRILDERRGTQAMTWIMAIMLFLTVLAVALGLGMVNAAHALDRQLAGRLTVQVVQPDPARRAQESVAVMQALASMPVVAKARAVDRAQLNALLQPWLGDVGADADVPVPTLIDVDLVAPGEDAFRHVVAGVRAVTPNARIDSQARWLAPVEQFMRTLIAGAGGLVLLMIGATVAVVLLTARTGLAAHRDTIAILHMLGSTDIQVARLFQRRIALDTLMGGVAGTVLAMLAVWFLTAQAASLGSELVNGGALSQRDWLILAALPILFALIAAVAARVAIVFRLRQSV